MAMSRSLADKRARKTVRRARQRRSDLAARRRGRAPVDPSGFNPFGLAPDEIIVDHFAGGGGASTGVGFAAGRSPDIAINHDPEAIAMHTVNHPDTRHYIENIWEVDPVEVCGGRLIGLLWTSPTCTHFSKAKGTALSEESIKLRALAWVTTAWAAVVAPRIICLENVEEFAKWGPLHKKHSKGCPGVKCARGCTFGKAAKRGGKKVKQHVRGCSGVPCQDKCQIYTPIKSRQGETFRAFILRLEKLGYQVEYRILRACDYGAPTMRKRLFLVARRDGLPIVWPVATHGPGRDKAHVAAATCIDWSDLGTSIFERERPLADKTMRRIAAGVQKFVLDRKPFLVPAGYGAQGENFAACAALLIKHNGGHNDTCGAAGQEIREPLHTVSTRDSKAIAAVNLVRYNGDVAGAERVQNVTEPLTTIDTSNRFGVVASHLVKMRGTSDAHIAASASSVEEPVPAISAQGTHIAQVAAFLVKYYGVATEHCPGDPIDTITTKDRFGLVTVKIDGEMYVIVDIKMRMLHPRELYLAQGFPASYVIEQDVNGKKFTRTAQVRMVGNSVPPQMAEVIARAQLTAGAPPAEFGMAA